MPSFKQEVPPLPSNNRTPNTGNPGAMANRLLSCTVVMLIIGSVPASAIEQCRFIEAKVEREACYRRQEAELAPKRKPEPAKRPGSIQSVPERSAGQPA